MHGEVHLNHKPWILVVRSEPGGTDSASDRSIAQLKDAIEAEGYRTEQTTTPADGLAIINTQPSYACVVLDWDLPEGQQFEERAAVKILRAVRARNKNVPIFLIADKTLVERAPARSRQGSPRVHPSPRRHADFRRQSHRLRHQALPRKAPPALFPSTQAVLPRKAPTPGTRRAIWAALPS